MQVYTRGYFGSLCLCSVYSIGSYYEGCGEREKDELVSALFLNSWGYEQKLFKLHMQMQHLAQWEQQSSRDPRRGEVGEFVKFLTVLTLDLKNRIKQQRVMSFALASQEAQSVGLQPE